VQSSSGPAFAEIEQKSAITALEMAKTSELRGPAANSIVIS
jgi:hypothetical protein